MGLRIIPLPLGTLEVSGAVLQSGRNFFERIDSQCMAWLILGGEEIILVDSGPANPEWSGKYHRDMRRGADEYLLPSLEKHGIAPGDIGRILLTHLHWDHVHGLADIPGVPVLVQRSEMRYASSPLPRDARPYEADIGAPALKAAWDRLVPLDGDTDIMPGLRVIHTPGHTPGCQAVLVETEGGVHAIAGDTINLFDSLTFNPPWPPGIYVNLEDFYASAKRLEAEADVILPGHDPALRGRVFPEV